VLHSQPSRLRRKPRPLVAACVYNRTAG